jgi:hypothetical protein
MGTLFLREPGPDMPGGVEHPRRAGRAWRPVAVAFALLATIAAVPAIVPADAQAIDGLERKYDDSDHDFDPYKQATAHCPADKRVVGGGGVISDGGENIARFTGIAPTIYPGSAYGRGFTASAEAIFAGRYVQWSVGAYAICADEDALDDYRIATETVENTSSATFVRGSAPCPTGTVAYSAGAGIGYDHQNHFVGRIGLPMVRTDGPMGIGRATARENTPLDFPNAWSLRVFAVCAKPQEGIHVEGAGDSDGDQEVTSFCVNPTTYVHGAGGGASGPGITDAGRSWLKKITPSASLRSLTVSMAGPEPPKGGVIASHTCAGGL